MFVEISVRVMGPHEIIFPDEKLCLMSVLNYRGGSSIVAVFRSCWQYGVNTVWDFLEKLVFVLYSVSHEIYDVFACLVKIIF